MLVGGLLTLTAYAIFFILYAAASSPPSTTLITPANNNVFNTTNNVTFGCNATDDFNLRKLELYTNINGTFSRTNTSCFGELCEDSSTALLMHFNNDSVAGENDTLIYDWSGNGNNATVFGATFNPSGGNFSGAFEFGGSDSHYMKISDSGTVDLSPNGTIELWMNANAIPSSDTYILMKAPGGSCMETAYSLIFTAPGGIELNLGSNGLLGGTYIYRYETAMSANQWYYIVATWNTTEVIIYVNNVSYYAVSNGGNPTPNFITNNNELWLGSTDQFCSINGEFLDGKIDELALYNRMLSAEEVSEHYNRSIAINATKNFTSQNVPDGTYAWNCRAYDNESQSGWSASNRTFYVDMASAPEVNSMSISPNATDDVDPNVQINVTANITDISGVNTAILQYVWPSGSVTNVTMGYNGATKLYNASFTPTVNGIWKYRIWANDTVGSAATRN